MSLPLQPLPVDTITAVANINPDYPGSCGRCYEVQCVTGVVVGNYSATGAPIPYNISQGFVQPGLNYDTLQDGGARSCLVKQDTAQAVC